MTERWNRRAPQAVAGGEPVGVVRYTSGLRAVADWYGEPPQPDTLLYTAPPPPAVREPLTDAQCDSIYEALDAFGREADTYEYGLPYCMSDGETLAKPEAREVIRQAASGITKGGQHVPA